MRGRPGGSAERRYHARMLIRARWIVPVCAPPIGDGVIRVADGLIREVRHAARQDVSEAIDLGDVAVLPGFVNAHTHLELTDLAGRVLDGRRPASLWEWIDALLSLRSGPAAADPVAAAQRGAALSLQAGVTLVADISRTGRPFLSATASPLRRVCFFELISGAAQPPRRAADLEPLLDDFERLAGRAAQHTAPSARCHAGISPHSLYNVARDDLDRAIALARRRRLPITMHLAETADEIEWLRDRRGPLAAFVNRFPGRASAAYAAGDLAAVLRDSGMLPLRPLLAHGNAVDDAVLTQLARSRCSVAYCPRTHAWFGHAPHRWRDMLAAGLNVCVGTDSLASNQTLCVLDELRAIRRQARDVPARTLLEMGTHRGAAALGLGDRCGALSPGLWADFAVVDVGGSRHDDIEAALLDTDWQVQATFIAGQRISG